jgi:hypothetical protein
MTPPDRPHACGWTPCPTCGYNPAGLPTATVTLLEARRLVGQTMNVDPEWWMWTPGEILWLVDQWRLRRPLPPLLVESRPPYPAVWFRALVDGWKWWLTDSPRTLRVMTAFAVLFCYGFGFGWFNA